MPAVRTNIEGLKELRSELARLGPTYAKALQQENKAITEDVARDARSLYTSMYPTRSGHGMSSIRGLATGTRAQVAIGGTRAPYMLGQEFGSIRFKQFGPVTRGGRFFWPTLRDAAETMVERYAEVLDRVAAKAFPVRRS